MGLADPDPTVDPVGEEEVSVVELVVRLEQGLVVGLEQGLVVGLEKGLEEELARVLVGQGIASVELWAIE